MNQFI